MKKKILVVEDEPGMVMLLKARLESRGYRVYSAKDGIEGIQKAKELHPDVILLDVMMPRLDGYSMAQRLKEDDTTTSIPLVVVTIKEAMRPLFKKLGVDYFFTKPFEDEELLSAVKRILSDER
ncbi:MAG: response regulator [Candidatus Omnitrophica bacterium]|nr:response regulator [Candidatus Omnitrophota bacterium]